MANGQTSVDILGPRPSPVDPAAPVTASGSPGGPDTRGILGAPPPAGPTWGQTIAGQVWPTAKYVGGSIVEGLASGTPGTAIRSALTLPDITHPVMHGYNLNLTGGEAAAPNPVARFTGGVGRRLATDPEITALMPGAALRGSIGAEIGHEAFPNIPAAEPIMGALGGATAMPLTAAGHSGGLMGFLVGEQGAELLHNTLNSIGLQIAPETSKFLAPLLGTSIPYIYNYGRQVLANPRMLLHPAAGAVMGNQPTTVGGNELSRRQD